MEEKLMTREELMTLLYSWNTPEGRKNLKNLLTGIVNDFPDKEGKRNMFRFTEVFNVFTEARDYAVALYKDELEAKRQEEKAREFYQECYDSKIAIGCTEEEARRYANDEVKAYF